MPAQTSVEILSNSDVVPGDVARAAENVDEALADAAHSRPHGMKWAGSDHQNLLRTTLGAKVGAQILHRSRIVRSGVFELSAFAAAPLRRDILRLNEARSLRSSPKL